MTAFLTAPPSGRSGSLGDLLATLGATGLRLASSDVARDLAVTRTVLFEPRRELGRVPGGILLAAGLEVSDPAARTVLDRAAANGFSAVVVKTYGEDAGPLARLADEHGMGLLVVHDDVEWLSLDSYLNNALVAASQVGSSDSAVAVGNLFSLAEGIAESVGGATAIEDYSQRVLAYSSRGEHPTDEERRDGILGRQVPDLPENAEQYRVLYRSPGVVRFPPSPNGYGRMAVTVRAGTEVLGSIWVVDATGDLDDRAEQVLLGAASLTALHLLRARSSEDLARQQRAEAARRLLDNVGDPEDAAAVLGLQVDGPFAVLAFAPAQWGQALETVAERLLPLVTLHCDTRLGRTGSVLLEGAVYVVAAGPRVRSAEALESLAAQVVSAGESSMRLDLLAAIGPAVDRPAHVTTAQAEAGRVLALLRRRPDLGPVSTHERVSDQMALAALGEMQLKDARLVPRRARAVLAHDDAHGTEYGRFLLVHLDHARDIGRTATSLSIHPNTVRYRLRRAAELFDLDLTSADEVLPLWLSLRSLLHEHPAPSRARS